MTLWDLLSQLTNTWSTYISYFQYYDYSLASKSWEGFLGELFYDVAYDAYFSEFC